MTVRFINPPPLDASVLQFSWQPSELQFFFILWLLKSTCCLLPSWGSSVFSTARISKGKTSWSGRSIVCPLRNNATPLTTPSLPCTRRTTFPFFHSLRFFSSPTTSTISPTLGVVAVSLFSLWLSIRLWTYSLFQHFHTWALASSNRLLIFISFSASEFLMSSTGYASRPHRITFGVSTSSSPPSVSTYVRGWLLRFL